MNQPSDAASDTATVLPHPDGLPGLRGRIRVRPDDFQVIEELGFPPSGAGEHVLLRVRKRAANTAWVARQIAAFAAVAPDAVSYAGLKDRHAVAEQWFSVHLAGRRDPDWPACLGADFAVLEHHRHHRKLRRGALKGNRFRIVIRALDGDREELTERMARLEREGAPNYFGDQRFGRNHRNLAHAEALFSGQERVKDRQRRGLYLSAARSHLFNVVLARRVADATWNRALAGDVMMLDGSHSLFPVAEVDETIRQRVTGMDIHSTGPLWGSGELPSQGAVRELERAAVSEFVAFRAGLEQAGLRQERRALRLRVTELGLETIAVDSVRVGFYLPAGGFATTVLRELARLVDSSGDPSDQDSP